MKYWNKARIQRVRARKARTEESNRLKQRKDKELMLTYTAGNPEKNAKLMLDALGSPIRLAMFIRLSEGGAMSLSKLSEPLGIRLTAAQAQLSILERVNLVQTHKRGRIRFCVANSAAPKELARWLLQLGRIKHSE